MGKCIITRRGVEAGNLEDYLKRYLISDYSASLDSDTLTIPYNTSQYLFCKDKVGKYFAIPLFSFPYSPSSSLHSSIDIYADSIGTYYLTGTSYNYVTLRIGYRHNSGGGSSKNFSSVFTEVKVLSAIQ